MLRLFSVGVTHFVTGFFSSIELKQKWQLIFLYIGRMDWGAAGRAFDHHSRKGDGAFANKNCPQGRAFDQLFSNVPGLSGVCPRGGGGGGGRMLAAGIDSHIKPLDAAFIAIFFSQMRRLFEGAVYE